MMNDMQILTQLIKNSAVLEKTENYNKYSITLREKKTEDSAVTINNLPGDALVLKVDTVHAHNEIFQCTKGECRRADYVIISEEQKSIIYIELKRTKGEWKQIVQQLQGAQCFVQYMQNLGKAFWREKNFLDHYKSRFVSIGHTNIAKRPTRIEKKSKTHDSPEKAIKIDWPHHIIFAKLAA